jgi:serine/threonine protein kinase
MNFSELAGIFENILQMPLEERETFLREMEKENPTLHTELDSLLKSHEKSESILDDPLPSSLVNAWLKTTPLPVKEQYGDFWIEEEIGRGAFAIVYKAHQLSLSRSVALKVTPNIGREAKTLAALEHTEIVKVHSEFVDQEKNIRIICMQFVDGESLDKLIGASWSRRFELLKNYDEAEARLKLMILLADALGFAHSKGIIHLDVKPANILINAYGHPFLADFNVSFTETHLLLGGTSGYMAPEHEACLDDPSKENTKMLSPSCDIFSFGVVLKEVFSPLPELKQYTEEIIEKCLQKDPKNRFLNGETLKKSLIGALELYQIHKNLPKETKILKFFRNHFSLALVLAIFVPQFVGSTVNIGYNSWRIISELTATQKQQFANLCVYYNLVVYPLVFYILAKTFFPFLIKPPSKEVREKLPHTVASIATALNRKIMQYLL